MRTYLLSLTLLFAASSLLAQNRPSTLPNFRFEALSGGSFTQNDLPTGRSVVVLYFDPTCEHCVTQAQWLRAENSRFTSTEFLWVTFSPKDRVQGFASQHLAGMSNHRVLLDTDWVFDEAFGYSQVPTILVFSASGRLVAEYNNEIAAEEIHEKIY